MSKYINADEYAKKLDYSWEYYFTQSQSTEGIDTALSILDDMPSADVVEAKHGEWQEVKRWECSTHSVTDMKCSVCHHYASQVLPHQTTCTYDFCPFCGADMRERKETDEMD